MKTFRTTVYLLCMAALLAALNACGKKSPDSVIAPPDKAAAGDRVEVHYLGSLQDGSIFDQTPSDTPLVFTIGSGQVIAGFNDAVVGMALYEEKKVTIPVSRAYGPVAPQLVKAFDRSMFPPEYQIEPGAVVRLRSPEGRPVPGRITEITDTAVYIDLNHPLAGQDLTFAIRLVSISRPPSAVASAGSP